MKHISFEMICRIADGGAGLEVESQTRAHLEECAQCRWEIEIQRSIVRISRQAQSAPVSANFTNRVVAAVLPHKEKKWYEKLLQNMGNIIALALVLGFLAYISSITAGDKTQIFFPSGNDLIEKSAKVFTDGSSQLLAYFHSSITTKAANSPQTNTIMFGLLAIFILAAIDRVIQHYFRHLEA